MPTILQEEHKDFFPIFDQLSIVSFNWSWKTEGLHKLKVITEF